MIINREFHYLIEYFMPPYDTVLTELNTIWISENSIVNL